MDDRLSATPHRRPPAHAELAANAGTARCDEAELGHSRPAAEKINELLRLFSLSGSRYVPISSYSKGVRQKILISAALLHNPDLVVLDEPFSGLDVNTALILRDLTSALASRGKVVLFSSHEVETVERVCSHVVILHRGRIVAVLAWNAFLPDRRDSFILDPFPLRMHTFYRARAAAIFTAIGVNSDRY